MLAHGHHDHESWNNQQTSFFRVVHPPSRMAKPVWKSKFGAKSSNRSHKHDQTPLPIANITFILLFNLHGESHEDSAHDPSSVIPLPDDVPVRGRPWLRHVQAGVCLQHILLLLLKIQIIGVQVTLCFVLSFLVRPVILVTWKSGRIAWFYSSSFFCHVTCSCPSPQGSPIGGFQSWERSN